MFEKTELIKKKKEQIGKIKVIGEKNGFSWGKDEGSNFWKKYPNSEWREMSSKVKNSTPPKRLKVIAVQGMKYWLQDKNGVVRQRETDIPLNLWHKKRNNPYFYQTIYKKHYSINYQ